MPWAVEERQSFCKLKNRTDGTRVIRDLQGEGPMASTVYRSPPLTGSKVEAVLTRFQNNRRCRVAFASFACATRLKLFPKEGELQPARCMKCGEKDSFGHLLSRGRIGRIPRDGTVEHLPDFLQVMNLEASKFAPFLPMLYHMPEPDEILLTGAASNRDAASRPWGPRSAFRLGLLRRRER